MRADTRVAGHVDALDIDAGRDLPVGTRLPGRHEQHRTPVEADDGNFVRLRRPEPEQAGSKVRPRGVQPRVSPRGAGPGRQAAGLAGQPALARRKAELLPLTSKFK